jgi:hypothetical protein
MRFASGAALNGWACLAGLCFLPMSAGGQSEERTFVYSLRGEVRPLLFWLGKDDVGGGRISLRTQPVTGQRWREEIEVLFGSEPERIPGRINRWGYGREVLEWVQGPESGAPRLETSVFEGLMRHSPEASMEEARQVPGLDGSAQPFDLTRSTVERRRAGSEFWVFTDAEDFHYARPARLLNRSRELLTGVAPLRRQELLNDPPRYEEPFGFLGALDAFIDRIVARPTAKWQGQAIGYVFNAKPYTLALLSLNQMPSFTGRNGSVHYPETVVARFRCSNTVKRTRTDFTLWIPLRGELKGIPVRILLQPRWWLRLRLDLDNTTGVLTPMPRGGGSER